MVVTLRPKSVTVDRGSRGFGLSLIYRGLDKYEEKDTGIFVARVVPGGQAARFGVRENDKIMTINSKTPRNVDDAVGVIKQAGNQIKLVVLREEDVPDIHVESDAAERTSLKSQDSNWMRETIGQQPISRSGSARSFNTTYGRPTVNTPSPRPHRAQFGSAGPQSMPPQQQQQPQQPLPQSMTPVRTSSPSPHSRQQQDFLRQQAEYRRQQLEAEQQQQLLAQQQEQQQQQLLAQQQALQQQQELIAQQQKEQELQQQQQGLSPEHSVKDTVRDIIANTDFSNFEPLTPNQGRRIVQETKKSTENITRIVQETLRPDTRQSNKYKSTHSLHELGLDNYPNPEYPESSRLTRKEEKGALQNLNNRLASYIDRVRQLQKENAKLTHQIQRTEEHQTREVTNVKDLYDKQIDELKQALENMNKQYNQLKVGAEGLLQENEDLKDKMTKKDRDLANSTNHVDALEDEVRDLSNKMSKLEQERQKAQEELNDALPELDSLRKKLTDLKRALDEEQLKKADLENKCDRLEEDLKFKMQLVEKELIEVKARKEVEINEMDGKLQEEYEDRLQKALEELREVYDKQMQQSRDDFGKLYDDRIRNLQSQLTNERGQNTSTEQQLKESKSRIDQLMSKVADLENANLALNQKIADLAQDQDDLKNKNRAQIAAKDNEIQRLLDELDKQLKDYQNLMDIKTALDMEIAVFKKLIESEEDRLGMGGRPDDTMQTVSTEPYLRRKHLLQQHQHRLAVAAAAAAAKSSSVPIKRSFPLGH